MFLFFFFFFFLIIIIIVVLVFFILPSIADKEPLKTRFLHRCDHSVVDDSIQAPGVWLFKYFVVDAY